MTHDEKVEIKIHIYDRMEKLDDVFNNGTELYMKDKQKNTRYKIIDVWPGGVIIERQRRYEMITYQGRENLQSDRYQVVDSNNQPV